MIFSYLRLDQFRYSKLPVRRTTVEPKRNFSVIFNTHVPFSIAFFYSYKECKHLASTKNWVRDAGTRLEAWSSNFNVHYSGGGRFSSTCEFPSLELNVEVSFKI